MIAPMTQSSPRDVDIVIVGAGLAGLAAAAELQRAGRQVLLLDKGRGVGGRLATRRIDGATFDHGAQFITVRDPRFQAALDGWQQAGAIVEWCRGFRTEADGHPRYRGQPGMSALPKLLAKGLDIHTEKQIAAIRPAGERWTAETATGEGYSARALLLTPPVPQTLALLEAGHVPLAPEVRSRLSALQYERCLATMAVLDGPSRVPPPGGFAPESGPIAWIADNQQKGVSAQPAVTVHATHAFSLEHWDRDRQEAGRLLLEAAAPWLGANVVASQTHGWRYSKPLQVDPEPCAILSRTPPLVLAGDVFGGPRVEGAALSGWAAAAAILSCAG